MKKINKNSLNYRYYSHDFNDRTRPFERYNASHVLLVIEYLKKETDLISEEENVNKAERILRLDVPSRVTIFKDVAEWVKKNW